MKTPNYLRFALAVVAGLWLQAGLRAQPATPPTEPANSDVTNVQAASGIQAEATETNSSGVASNAETDYQGWRHGGSGPLISVGHDVELKSGETAEAVVVIGGSAKVKGNVRNAAVVLFGDLDVEGRVGEGAVAIMGNVHVAPAATVHGQAVAVGGRVECDPAAKLDGEPMTFDFPDWVKQWFLHCFLKMRPLAPQVGWVWAIAGVVFLLYLLIAALFPRPVEACVSELTRRPATTFLLGLLAQLLVPLVLVILAATGIGLIVVPFILAAVILGAMVGKVALLEWLGLRLGAHFGSNGLQNRLVAFVIGVLILTLFYMVPVVGLLVFSITAVWGFGAGVTAAFVGLRKEMPERQTRPATATMAGSVPMAGHGSETGGNPSSSFADESTGHGDVGEGGGGVATATAPATATLPASPPVMPDILAYPKAGFWERMGADFLDVVLVSIIGALVGGPPLAFLVALAYFAGMWTWKGTTIGGIVLGLKVLRTDGREVTFATALVRALAAAFSLVVLFLGFLWIAWDPEKQGWHDKIAGTVVLKLPRGTPLVMI